MVVHNKENINQVYLAYSCLIMAVNPNDTMTVYPQLCQMSGEWTALLTERGCVVKSSFFMGHQTWCGSTMHMSEPDFLDMDGNLPISQEVLERATKFKKGYVFDSSCPGCKLNLHNLCHVEGFGKM